MNQLAGRNYLSASCSVLVSLSSTFLGVILLHLVIFESLFNDWSDSEPLV